MNDEYRLVIVPDVDDDTRRVVVWTPDGRAWRRSAGFHGQESAMAKASKAPAGHGGHMKIGGVGGKMPKMGGGKAKGC